jgi:hypothetical protein
MSFYMTHCVKILYDERAEPSAVRGLKLEVETSRL